MERSKKGVRDGASLRRERFLTLVEYVNSQGGHMHLVGVQAYMTLTHGLKRTTTLEYVRELCLAGVLSMNDAQVVAVKLPLPKWYAQIATADPYAES